MTKEINVTDFIIRYYLRAIMCREIKYVLLIQKYFFSYSSKKLGIFLKIFVSLLMIYLYVKCLSYSLEKSREKYRHWYSHPFLNLLGLTCLLSKISYLFLFGYQKTSEVEDYKEIIKSSRNFNIHFRI